MRREVEVGELRSAWAKAEPVGHRPQPVMTEAELVGSEVERLEAGGSTVHYRGSIATFFYSRQAVGVYKCCNTVYGAPGAREFKFDTDFLNPAKLPPLTPMFRDLNALNFRQEFRPGR